MRIDVKLYGELKKYAPGDKTAFVLTLKRGATLQDVLKSLCIPDEHHVSLINGRRAHQTTRFDGGDTLVMFPPISGG